MTVRGKKITPVAAGHTAPPRTRRQTHHFSDPRPHQPLPAHATGRGRLVPSPSPPSFVDEAGPNGTVVEPGATASCARAPFTRAAARRLAAECVCDPVDAHGNDAASDMAGKLPVAARTTRDGNKNVAVPAAAAEPTTALPIVTRSSTRGLTKVMPAAVNPARSSAVGKAPASRGKGKKVVLPAAAAALSAASPVFTRFSTRGLTKVMPAAVNPARSSAVGKARASRGKGKKVVLPAAAAALSVASPIFTRSLTRGLTKVVSDTVNPTRMNFVVNASVFRGKGKKEAVPAPAAALAVVSPTVPSSPPAKGKKVAVTVYPMRAGVAVEPTVPREKVKKAAVPAATAALAVVPPTVALSLTRDKGKQVAVAVHPTLTSPVGVLSLSRVKGNKVSLSAPARTTGPVTRSTARRGVAFSDGQSLGSSMARNGTPISRAGSGVSGVRGDSPPPRGPGPGGRTPKALRDLAGAAGANFMAQWTPSSPSPSPEELKRRRRASARRRRSDPRTRSGSPLVLLPQLSSDPGTWSPPPTRDTRRLAEYSRRLAVLPAENSSTDDEGAARVMRRRPVPAGTTEVLAADATAGVPATSDNQAPPPVGAMHPPLPPAVEERMAVVVAAHEVMRQKHAAIKMEMKQEPIVSGPAVTSAASTPVPCAAFPPVTTAAASVSAAATPPRSAVVVPPPKMEPTSSGDCAATADGTVQRRGRTKRPPRRHIGC